MGVDNPVDHRYWNCADMCDSGIDSSLKELAYLLSDELSKRTEETATEIDRALCDMIKERHSAFRFLANAVQGRIEEVKHDEDNDGFGCDDCNGYAVQVEDLEVEVKELKSHPTLNWQGRTLEHRRDNVFVDTTTGDAFELKPSTELVSICKW